jgi:hypothetical protein
MSKLPLLSLDPPMGSASTEPRALVVVAGGVGEGQRLGKCKTGRRWGRANRAGILTHMWHIDASTEGAIAVIAAWLRHVSSAFTMATYVHSQEAAPAVAARSLRGL